MRLLTVDFDGKLVLRVFDGDHVPKYAIVSHIWHIDDNQEVSFQDLESSAIKNKAGYAKTYFCQKQAAADGLLYFWIDTYCRNTLQHRVQA